MAPRTSPCRATARTPSTRRASPSGRTGRPLARPGARVGRTGAPARLAPRRRHADAPRRPAS
eukprot:2342610-Prymnesium_polylepis.1